LTTDSDQKLEIFLHRIDEYLENKDLAAPAYMDEHKIGEQFSLDSLGTLTQDECFNYALGLTSYLDHVVAQRSKQEAVVKYCDHHLTRIVAREYMNMADVYGPYDLKEEIIIRENEVATKLSDFRMVASTRILTLKSREFNLRKKIDLLNEKGKRL
jgi:hypothetical protein